VLAEYHIPFVRFCATGFYPKEMKLYQENCEAYFRLMDGVVRCAEKNGVGLIPSLFWYNTCVPDMMGEHLDQWGNPDSKTVAFMRQYTHEVVSRYRSSPAIWAWEYMNEFDSYCDLPNAATFLPTVPYPQTHTNLGQPAVRTPEDYPKFKNFIVAAREFALAVRRDDPHRLIDNGCSMLDQHNNLWHRYKENSWTVDTPQDFGLLLDAVNPDPVGLVSVHLYDAFTGGKKPRRFSGFERLDEIVTTVRKLGKPLFVGEFQYGRTLGPDGYPTADFSPEERHRFIAMLAKFDQLQVPLAAAWVFDYPPHEKEDWNINATNKRAWQLPLLREHNVKLTRARQDER
jgi:hypothetical protein